MSKASNIIHDPFTIKYVGANLFNELSKSLYEPEHVIREYLQNAVDSHKQWRDVSGSLPDEAINVEILSNSVSIIDFGIGMTEEEMKNVKAIAISKKSKQGADLTGQKGVGVWSGLSFFDRISIISTKHGEKKRFNLTIEFAKIRKKLISEEADSLSVGDVMESNYQLSWEDCDEEDHGTTVILHNPKEQITSFLDPDNIIAAVRRFAPCRVDSSFIFSNALNKWYEENAVTILPIAVCGSEVFKTFSNDVVGFSASTITVNNTPVAKTWLAISASNNLIKDDLLRIPSGFALVQNGFALDRDYGTEQVAKLPKIDNPYLSWYIGEMHVTNEYVLPNLNRKGLQINSNTLALIQNLREWYDLLDAETRQIAALRNHLDAFNGMHSTLDEINGLIHKDDQTGKDDKLIEKFIHDFGKEQKKLGKLPDISKKGTEFPLYVFKMNTHKQVLKLRTGLNSKWKEVREDRPHTPKLSEISKSTGSSTPKNGKTAHNQPPVVQITAPESSVTPPSLNLVEAAPQNSRIELTIPIAINVLRDSIDAMEPFTTTTIVEKIIREYSKNLTKVVGDV